MSDALFWQALGLGAGLVVVVVVVVLLVVGIVFWFSGRDHDRKDAEKESKADRQHTEVIGRFDQMTRNFALIAKGQGILEARVVAVEDRMKDHSGSISELRERLGLNAEK